MRRADDVFFEVSETRAEGLLDVGDGHHVHWEEAGAPDGMPWINAHGGPGGRGNPIMRTLLDTRRIRLVQFDQRGCGLSTPKGELTANSLQHTIADMEAIREHLGIARWVVGGASWGSTVALAYAEAHPERCLGVQAAAIWLCRARDIDWWYRGVQEIFPDLWEAYAGAIPEAERGDLPRAYWRRIMSEDLEVAQAAAAAQFYYEEGFMRLEPPFAPLPADRALNYSRIFSHYAVNGFWVAENQLIDQAHRLKGVPVSLVNGRYDMCTTPIQAWDMAKALDPADVRLTIVNVAGHYPTESAMARALATEHVRFLDHLDALGRR
jgi:proline iminopeptidase